MEDLQIYQQILYNRAGHRIGKLAVLIGGLRSEQPIMFMDAAVSNYVGRTGYSEFIEIHMDNPWVRVILTDLNNLQLEEYTNQTLDE